MEFIVVWIVLAVLVGAFANSRGRSGFGYFLLSVLLSPLLGFVIVLVTADLAKEAIRQEEERRADERKDFDRKAEHEKQLESLRVLAKTPAAGPAVVTVADEIAKLGDLLGKGLLTEAEFADQKAAVLKRAV